MFPTTFTVALAATLLFASPVRAAHITFVPALDAIFIDSTIEGTDVEHLTATFDAAVPKPTRIYVNSPGGDFHAAIGMGEWIRSKGLDTYAGQFCMSACAYLWLGGVNRFANNLVLIHAPFVRTSYMSIDVPTEGIMDSTWYLARLGYKRALIDAIFAVGSTESNEAFPITGPETHYLQIGYTNFIETPFRDELVRLRAAR